MKILHTSDWHLGRMLSTKKDRTGEHIAFLTWLKDTIICNEIDILIVCGDIFDTTTPTTTAQKIYYDFLVSLRDTPCQNIVIIAGNHDSPSFLNATKEILSILNVYVIPNATENPEDEVIVVKDKSHTPQAIICAVPYLRYIRNNQEIIDHYTQVSQIAQDKRNELNTHVPIIATGHLSVLGGKTITDDGVRNLYIGNIDAVGSDIFPPIFDYIALGHYHIPSKIKENIIYCGSPIPMGFSEAKQQKNVVIIDFHTEHRTPHSTFIEVPTFQKLHTIQGSKSEIEQLINELKQQNTSIWAEVIYTGDTIFPDLTDWINDQVADSPIEVIKRLNKPFAQSLSTKDTEKSLEELSPIEVFEKILEINDIAAEQRETLRQCYNEILLSIQKQ